MAILCAFSLAARGASPQNLPFDGKHFLELQQSNFANKLSGVIGGSFSDKEGVVFFNGLPNTIYQSRCTKLNNPQWVCSAGVPLKGAFLIRAK